MRPPRLHFQSSVPIAVIAFAFLMVFSWTVILASAQDKNSQGATEAGTIHTTNKLAVQKYGHNSVYLGDTWYKFTIATKFLDEASQRIGRKSIPVGSLVNVIYVTDKKSSEVYPFNPKDKVLLTIQVVATANK